MSARNNSRKVWLISGVKTFLFKDFSNLNVGISVSDYSSNVNYCYTYFDEDGEIIVIRSTIKDSFPTPLDMIPLNKRFNILLGVEKGKKYVYLISTLEMKILKKIYLNYSNVHLVNHFKNESEYAFLVADDIFSII